MVEGDKRKFAETLALFGAIHKETITIERQKAYWFALQEMQAEEFDRVSKHLLKHTKWFPKPADFWSASKSVGWT